MEETKVLEVGDVIYEIGNYGVRGKMVVDRVTPKRAYVGMLCFDRTVESKGWITRIGEDRWSTASYRIESEDLKAQLAEKKIRRKVTDFNQWAKLSIEDATAVSDIISKYTNP